MANMKKLDDEARMRIQGCLAKGYGPRAISKEIGYSLATVYRELIKGSVIKNKGAGRCQKCLKRFTSADN